MKMLRQLSLHVGVMGLYFFTVLFSNLSIHSEEASLLYYKVIKVFQD